MLASTVRSALITCSRMLAIAEFVQYLLHRASQILLPLHLIRPPLGEVPEPGRHDDILPKQEQRANLVTAHPLKHDAVSSLGGPHEGTGVRAHAAALDAGSGQVLTDRNGEVGGLLGRDGCPRFVRPDVRACRE